MGFQNYIDVFTEPVLKQTRFYQLFAQTLIWTVVNIFFHVVLGIGLALMLNRRLRGRTVYRALLILPWAIPAVASLQIWRTEYNFEYGAVNQVLGLIGLGPIPWLSDPFWNFAAMIITNIWLGVPFMMVITLGGLQSISQRVLRGCRHRRRHQPAVVPHHHAAAAAPGPRPGRPAGHVPDLQQHPGAVLHQRTASWRRATSS